MKKTIGRNTTGQTASGATNWGLEIRYTLRAFTQALSRKASSVEVTAAEFRLLRTLGEGEGSTQSELASLAAMDRPYVSSLVKKMIERGLLQTKVNAEDRRRVDIVFSPDGAKVYRRISRELGKVNRDAVAGIDAKALETFHSVLAAIRDNLEQP